MLISFGCWTVNDWIFRRTQMSQLPCAFGCKDLPCTAYELSEFEAESISKAMYLWEAEVTGTVVLNSASSSANLGRTQDTSMPVGIAGRFGEWCFFLCV